MDEPNMIQSLEDLEDDPNPLTMDDIITISIQQIIEYDTSTSDNLNIDLIDNIKNSLCVALMPTASISYFLK